MSDKFVWLSIAGFPAVILIVGGVLRFLKGAPQTCATDVFGLFIILDMIVITDAAHFAKTIGVAYQSIMTLATLTATFFAVVSWTLCISWLEPSLIDQHTGKTSNNRIACVVGWLAAWSMCATLIIAHVALFTGRIPL